VRQTLSGLALMAMDFRYPTRVRHRPAEADLAKWRPAKTRLSGEPKVREPVFADSSILTIPFDRDNLAEMRSLVSAAADHAGLDRRRVDDLLVVATELATNAVRHAGGFGVLRLWLGEGALHCRVTDEGPGLVGAEAAGFHQVPASSDEGRGLWLARELSDGLSVVAGKNGTSATATFRLP
jgi:anti-sigma regulatory factor (Ser/Thr protein kinase)